MNNKEKRAVIVASGLVLTTHLPEDFNDEDWLSDDGETIDEWVVENACEPYEHQEPKFLWERISQIASVMLTFHEREKHTN